MYSVSKDDPNQPVEDIGMIEDGYDQMGRDDSRLPDVDDAFEKKQIEYRYHKRFQLKKDAFALIRSLPTGSLKIDGKSMGCIASAVFDAKPARLGKIDNISMGGLMFHHVDSQVQINQAVVLDILLADSGFYLANIPFKTITDVLLPDDVSSDTIKMRQVRLQYLKLNPVQRASLKDFILNHGTEISSW